MFQRALLGVRACRLSSRLYALIGLDSVAPNHKSEQRVLLIMMHSQLEQVCGTGKTCSGVAVSQMLGGGSADIASENTPTAVTGTPMPLKCEIRVRPRYTFESGSAIVYC